MRIVLPVLFVSVTLFARVSSAWMPPQQTFLPSPLTTVWMTDISSSLSVSNDDDSSSTTTTTLTQHQHDTTSTTVPSFLLQTFLNTECDNVNVPPSLNILLRHLRHLTNNNSSDIRGRFVDHVRQGHLARVAKQVAMHKDAAATPLTPLAAYCLGYALAELLVQEKQQQQQQQQQSSSSQAESNEPWKLRIVIGTDPRTHSMRLADAVARGAAQYQLKPNQQSSSSSSSSSTTTITGPWDEPTVEVVYTGLASTPACAYFCTNDAKDRGMDCDAAVMMTASHLPGDRNGLKFFRPTGGFTKDDIYQLGIRAQDYLVQTLFRDFQIPPTSGDHAVMCSRWVEWMPLYAQQLQDKIVQQTASSSSTTPLKGLSIVLNSGNGSGGFFAKVLQNLGATVTPMGIDPDGTFPNNVPNPESPTMVHETIKVCQEQQADLGILLDTDADRCGFVVHNTRSGQYEALNRNRLIALLAVMFARTSPGCAIVTDSVTSEGLTTFIQSLGLHHVRYLKGYANVINKAKELTMQQKMNCEVAIETSGHCAMKENNYLDDGTYTAVKVVSLLAKERCNLMDLIEELQELDTVSELRMTVRDESLETLQETFDFCALTVEENSANTPSWQVDMENLEGIRVRVGDEGQFFMLRKSLHDPIISLQIEAKSPEEAKELIVKPLLKMFESEPRIQQTLDMNALEKF